MNFLHLHYFKLVAKSENITKAAQEAYISTSGLSKVISRLESEVGYPLFERYSNRLVLNSAGRIFYDFAENVLSQQDECLAQIKTTMSAEEEIVNIAVPAERLVKAIINKYMKENPNIRFSQYIMNAVECQNALENREIDFAICHRPIEAPGIIWTPLCEKEMCIAVGWNHPLAKADIKEISLIDLKDELFFVHASSSDERDAIIDFCREAGFVPRIYQSDPAVTFEVLEKGTGAAFVLDYFFMDEKSQRLTDQYMNGSEIAHKVSLHNPRCFLPIGIARIENRPLSERAALFYHMMCEKFEEDEEECP